MEQMADAKIINHHEALINGTYKKAMKEQLVAIERNDA